MPCIIPGAPRAGILALLLLACAVPAAPAGAAPRYRVEDLSRPGASFTDAVGLNNRGEVALNAWDPVAGRADPVVHRQGGVTSVADRFDRLYALNDRGDLVGTAGAGGAVLLWRGGRLLDLRGTFEGGAWSGWALAINNRGHVTGTMQSGDGAPSQAFVFDGRRGRYLPLLDNGGESWGYGINRAGMVVGTAHADPGLGYGFLGFFYDGAQSTWLPTLGFLGGSASALNDAGQVVGYSTPDLGSDGSFLWDGGELTPLGAGGVPADINNRGWIVGNSLADGGPWLYRDGQAQALDALLDPAAAAHWRLHTVSAVNDRGQVLGRALLDGQDIPRPVLLTPAAPVPEPRAWALALGGLCGLSLVLRRRPTRPRACACERSQPGRVLIRCAA